MGKALKLFVILLALVAGFSFMPNGHGQAKSSSEEEEKDSLVVLLSSKSAQMLEIDGIEYRKVIGPARFLHNDTYLICDTALWNVKSEVIEAWGNVSILQNDTELTSDRLTYFIKNDLAEFRGSTVQLIDKDYNTLRTRHLDYNTADSVAVFQQGGAMRDKDGQIIESRSGRYESKIKTFTFNDDVNMFTDSVFVKTRSLLYESEKDLATFSYYTDAWKDDNMLSSEKGWYDKGNEVFFFENKVHVMTEDQEGWCDTLYFYRNTSDVEMLGNAQVTDTTRNVFALAGRIEYVDSTSRVTFTRKPAVISQTEDAKGVIDTLYLGAEKLVYYTIPRCDVDSLVALDAAKRKETLNFDAVGEYRKKAAEEAAKAAEEAAMNDPNQRAKAEADALRKSALNAQAKPQAQPQTQPQTPKNLPRPEMPSQDSISRPEVPQFQDSLHMQDSLNITDSLHVQDSLQLVPPIPEPKDTTAIGFLEALRKVKIYRKDMQIVCDSLLYSDLDSLGRLYKSPIIWQEISKQYVSDSLYIVVEKGSISKANLISNAFITIQEDTSHYNQIKGAEMMAYFDENSELERFDALGGASALFYLEENGTLATVNKPESKMLSAVFKDGEIQKIYYFDTAKSDAYPVVDLSREDQQLKGFGWTPELRPEDRNAVTPLSLRPSQRKLYDSHPRPVFKQTDIYFPGYMDDVYHRIAVRDSLQRLRERDRQLAEQAEMVAPNDSLDMVTPEVKEDALKSPADSLQKSSTDSVSVAPADTVSVVDSLMQTMSPKELKAHKRKLAREAKRKEREAKKQRKLEELEKKWEEKNKRDAEKLAAKEAKKRAKERERKRKALIDAALRDEEERMLLEKYKREYLEEQKKEKQSKKKNRP